MTDNPVLEFWSNLPQELAYLLAQGFTGRTHLLKVARAALASGDQQLYPVAGSALTTAFSENPLDGVFAEQMLRSPEVSGLLSDETVATLQAVKELWREPRSADHLTRLAGKKDFRRIKEFIARQAATDPENLFWASKAAFFGLVDNDPDFVESLLPPLTGGPADKAQIPLREEIERFRGTPCEPDPLVAQGDPVFGRGWGAMHAGLRLAREGYRDEAALWLMEAFKAMPWNAGLLLRLHDHLGSVDLERSELPGRTAVLLYSWNKKDDLDATLGSLFRAEDDPDLLVLDNGSDDGTATILEQWEYRFDARREGSFTRISLPVNTGAAVARNWLLKEALERGYAFLCYLDDDVDLPADWLRQLGAAVQRYPEASVWGCKVVDHANTAIIQHADHQLEIPENQGTGDPSLFVQTLDAGLFDYMRPCDSVTGCCHLFRAETLRASGGFDIRLSPSQYDDLEHDIRLLKNGGHAVYQGHLTVRHRKRSGMASHSSPQAEGNALGNKFKLQALHPNEELRDLEHIGRQRLLKDLREKAAHLGLMLDVAAR
ncbi:glycosyltransferase family 2 protein [Desulfovibrio oxyclinae]|uniref:glycosyltransferase family 2 protein n=1 Tax=Desulfovibrio oxyclinae TaxID=63560 RepID=UPI00037C29DC|nr:glycosyltransferase family 2 protein [Desulfovibrio oxyclinae]